MYTNITLQGQGKKFNYIVEYKPSDIRQSTEGLYCREYDDKLVLCENLFKYEITNGQYDDVYDIRKAYNKNTNVWESIDIDPSHNLINNLYNDLTYKAAEFTVYFPQHSVDVYKPGVKYMISISIQIYNKEVFLGSYELNRIKSYILPYEKIFLNEQYYECVKFSIVDPRQLIYGDEWEVLRNYCLTNSTKITKDLNDMHIGPVLYVSLHPVEELNGQIKKLEDYNGGQNSINISSNKNDYMQLELTHNLNEYLIQNDQPSFICNLNYNGNIIKHLKNNYEYDLEDKLSDTQKLFRYEFIIGNENETICILRDVDQKGDIVWTQVTDDVGFQYACKFEKSKILKSIKDNGGILYKNGLYAVASLILSQKGNINNEITIISNKIPITVDLFKFFVSENKLSNDSPDINSINLNDIYMNVYNINTVNKINQNIIHIDNLDQSKSNIISPTFFRSVDSSDIVIHPDVKENICIKLDQYKNKVDMFFIKIEDVLFQEIARIQTGVIFKIDKPLPQKSQQGTYYILDQNEELVTLGKYTYSK